MADIVGTGGNDILDGTGDADVITGLGGNDTINANGGDDIINGGTGNDTLNGGEGNDLFIEDQITSATDVFNGGNGIDTIELRAIPTPIATSIGTLSFHSLSAANSMTSIERLVFVSPADQLVQATVLLSAVPTSGLTELVGSSGREFVSFATNTAGSFTMPVLTLTNWTGVPVNAWDVSADFLVLGSSAAAGLAVTLNAAAGLNTLQILNGGNGNDTLNGSANADSLNGNGGINQLSGGSGNDLLSIINTSLALGGGVFGAPTTFSGQGGTYDGGTGTDLLGIGGFVSLEANLVGIEGVLLLPAFTPVVANIAKQDAAVLELDSAHLAMLPGNAFFRGTGTVVALMDGNNSFNGAGYTIEAGSTVSFEVYGGTGNGLSFTGNSGADAIYFGIGNQSATGGAGADRFGVGIGVGTVTDFTINTDKIDFSDTGISSAGRLGDISIVQTGANVTISADSGGNHFEMVLQNVSLAALTLDHYLLDAGGYNVFESGTTFDDLLFGFALNDELHGDAGNDRIYSGGGFDRMFGDGGNDILILDGAIPATQPPPVNAVYDGGAGTDTLLLRNYAGAPVNNGLPSSLYSVFPSQAGGGLIGIERIEFDSDAGTAITGVVSHVQIASSGLTELVGGAGRDGFVAVVTAAGSYSLSSLTLTNWDTSANGDSLVLFAAGNLNDAVTFNARGDAFNQHLIGANGNDVLNGSANADTLRGNAGLDTLNGGGGADLLYGGQGDDSYTVDQQGDLVFEIAGEGTDTLTSTASFYLYAEVENLILAAGSAAQFGVGNELANTLTGNENANLLIAWGGNDTIHAGAGNDVIYGVDGADTINGDAGVDYIAAGIGNDIVNGGDGSDEIYGEAGDDVLTGGASFDFDILVGGDGNDTLRGDSTQGDFDYLYGNLGDDIFYVDTPADLEFENPGEGTDTVFANINGGGFYLHANVENLTLLGSTPFGVGNDLANVLTGNAIANFLLGGAGNDTLNGKAGGDVLFGEGGADTFVFEAGTGGDVIGDFAAGIDKINLTGIFATFTEAQANFVQNGNIGAINLGNGDLVVLHNVTMSQLTATDFIFG